MSSEAAMDISNAALQDELASSLLDAPIVGNWMDGNWDSAADERVAEEWPNGFGGDEAEELSPDQLALGPGERWQSETEEGEQEVEQEDGQQFDPESTQQTQEFTEEEVNSQIGQLYDVIEQSGLNDRGAAQQLGYDLTAPFGADSANVDSDALGQAMSVLGASSIEFYLGGGRIENAPPIHAAAASYLTTGIAQAFGMDDSIFDTQRSQDLAEFTRTSYLGILDAFNTNGIDAPLHRVNAAETAQAAGNRLNQIFGINEPMPLQHAMYLANSFATYVRAQVKLWPQRAEEQRQDSDYFDNEAIEMYRREHGRL
jgi:hypothetical protein